MKIKSQEDFESKLRYSVVDMFEAEKRTRQQTAKELMDVLIAWGKSEQKLNDIYRKSTDELNDDWIDKFEEIKKKYIGVKWK